MNLIELISLISWLVIDWINQFNLKSSGDKFSFPLSRTNFLLKVQNILQFLGTRETCFMDYGLEISQSISSANPPAFAIPAKY